MNGWNIFRKVLSIPIAIASAIGAFILPIIIVIFLDASWVQKSINAHHIPFAQMTMNDLGTIGLTFVLIIFSVLFGFAVGIFVVHKVGDW